ncbi:MAG: aminoacyl--tRNA ligase-related protein, partial [Thermoanaerobaculia bacterium]|nr:aminoacyl--tRNA ligase-related protein [Thermoanaerobaculia bacterium]
MSAQSIQLTLPDGSVREYPVGTTSLEVARSIGAGLAKAVVGAELAGRVVDLREPLTAGGPFRLFTTKSPEAGSFLRHSAEHVLADAVKRLWPDAEYDAGRQDHSEKFQYDFRFPRAFTPEDLEAIEAKMREILAEGHEFRRFEVTREQADQLFAERGETLKRIRLNDIPDGVPITVYQHGEFLDLCRGPHAQNLGQIGAVKLLNTSGAYFKGDEANEMLQRIYGTAFGSAKELEEYERLQEEARARDHRRLGTELDLFSFNPLAPAMPFFHPKGALVYNLLVEYIRGLYRRFDYREVITPQVLDVDLWHKSGHYENYRENMFFTSVEDRDFAVKPMNCPTHCLMYSEDLHSYRELPIRFADFGRLHRFERSGVVHGLTRVRSFCQDDAHIYCAPEQIASEIRSVIGMIRDMNATFGFDQ